MTISSNQLRSPTLTEEEYGVLLERIRNAVATHVDEGSTVLMVNKGDDALVDLAGRTGWHFPRDEEGGYPGFYPADSRAAIAHLEELRAKGADYILLPSPAFWWLEHYPQFAQHLELNYRLVARDDSTCLIFRLREPEEEPVAAGLPGAHFTKQLRRFLDAVLPLETSVILVGTGDPQLVNLGGQRESQVLKIEASLPTEHPGARYASQIEYLAQRHSDGAEYVVIRGSDGHHDQYESFREEVAARYRQVARQNRFCTVFDLGAPLTEDHRPPPASAIRRLVAALRRFLGLGQSRHESGSARDA